MCDLGTVLQRASTADEAGSTTMFRHLVTGPATAIRWCVGLALFLFLAALAVMFYRMNRGGAAPNLDAMIDAARIVARNGLRR